jgi:carbonic anhydrase
MTPLRAFDGSDASYNRQNGLNSGLSPSCASGPASVQGFSRRGFIQQTVIRTIGGLFAAAGVQLRRSPRALGQTKLGPDTALQELMNGNQRFMTNHLTAHDADLAVLKRNTIEKQEPFAAVLSCADSRVPVELIFDQSIGGIFVARIAGNVVTSEIIASLEYGAAILGTKAILVMGHSNCGAVKATIQGEGVPGQISALYPHIRPAVDQAGPNPEAVSKANAKIQAALLRQSSTVISDLVKEGKLKVIAGYYDLASGSAALLD